MPNNYVCGWCGTTTPRHIIQQDAIPHPLDEGTATTWNMLRCAACQGWSLWVEGFPAHVSLTAGRQLVHDGKKQIQLPPKDRTQVNLAMVPATIAGDYNESIQCLQAGAYKGAAVLARRSVEMTCNHLLGKGEKLPEKLWAKIDLLASEGELTKKLAGLAHRVRVFGNFGAHPGDDGLDSVTEEEANQAVAFLEHLLQHVFIFGEPEKEDAEGVLAGN